MPGLGDPATGKGAGAGGGRGGRAGDGPRSASGPLTPPRPDLSYEPALMTGIIVLGIAIL